MTVDLNNKCNILSMFVSGWLLGIPSKFVNFLNGVQLIEYKRTELQQFLRPATLNTYNQTFINHGGTFSFDLDLLSRP